MKKMLTITSVVIIIFIILATATSVDYLNRRQVLSGILNKGLGSYWLDVSSVTAEKSIGPFYVTENPSAGIFYTALNEYSGKSVTIEGRVSKVEWGTRGVNCESSQLGCAREVDTVLPERIYEVPLTAVHIVIGMERLQVEKLIAVTLGKQSTYSPYGNSLLGGMVKYTDGISVLEVMYNAGAPAPSIVTVDGKVQGYPPTDETVKSFRTYKVGVVSQ